MEQGKKRILFVANSGPMHINKFHLPFIEYFLEQGHEVHVATKDVAQVKIDKKIDFVRFDIDFSFKPNTISFWRQLRKTREIIKNNEYDIIYTHTAIPSSIVRVIAKREINTRIIYFAHGFHFHSNSTLLSWLLFYPIEKYLSRFTDDLIVINKEDYNLCKNKKFKMKRLHLLMGVGIDFTSLISNKENKTKNKYQLYYAADLNKNKNQKLLIQMLKYVTEEVPQVTLVLSGTGPEYENLRHTAIELGVSEKVIFTGFISRQCVYEYISDSSLVVASSLREGLPINVIEAMYLKVPVIATNIRGHNDLIVDGKNGYLLPPDAFLFSKKVIKLLKDESLKNKLGHQASKDVQKYDIKEIIKEIEVIFFEGENK